MALSVLLFLKKQPGFPEKIEKVGWGGGGFYKNIALKNFTKFTGKKAGSESAGTWMKSTQSSNNGKWMWNSTYLDLAKF